MRHVHAILALGLLWPCVVLAQRDPDILHMWHRSTVLAADSTLEVPDASTMVQRRPDAAAALALLFPSAGHLYAGNWGRGLIFLGLEGLCAYIMSTGIETRNWQTYATGKWRWEYGSLWYDGQGSVTRSETTLRAPFRIGLVGLLVFKVWEMLDAGGEARRYNESMKANAAPVESSTLGCYLHEGPAESLCVGFRVAF
jgi:hypothetical protein